MNQHLNRYAYNRGFSAFIAMNFDNPYKLDTYANKEWERGQNAAYFMFVKRSKLREANRQNRSV